MLKGLSADASHDVTAEGTTKESELSSSIQELDVCSDSEISDYFVDEEDLEQRKRVEFNVPPPIICKETAVVLKRKLQKFKEQKLGEEDDIPKKRQKVNIEVEEVVTENHSVLGGNDIELSPNFIQDDIDQQLIIDEDLLKNEVNVSLSPPPAQAYADESSDSVVMLSDSDQDENSKEGSANLELGLQNIKNENDGEIDVKPIQPPQLNDAAQGDQQHIMVFGDEDAEYKDEKGGYEDEDLDVQRRKHRRFYEQDSGDENERQDDEQEEDDEVDDEQSVDDDQKHNEEVDDEQSFDDEEELEYKQKENEEVDDEQSVDDEQPVDDEEEIDEDVYDEEDDDVDEEHGSRPLPTHDSDSDSDIICLD
ncbi:unnamed protein product [Bursaphelenchus okinawaensis]|uniref:Uncharacterized protein n=1 Tax=Bursaphelenchus okinawaensis TaxID=465554 RepID=A0A811KTE2_9BILA|nr:unnamed protein product [Bursaphelenchus okinawaensis]CAG9109346.1 unnamed protein product [Bursaphelenchus okinawaensis]